KDVVSLDKETTDAPIQRAAINDAPDHDVLPSVTDALRSPGQSLDSETRTFMESRFGHDFTDVRVHTDERAAESAQAVNALAYTVGNDMVFGAGQYEPKTPQGQYLIAHELAHVAQQEGTASSVQPFSLEPDNSRAECEATEAANAVLLGQS